MQTITNRGVPGTRMDEIAERIAATWTPNSRGFVGLCCTINDPRQYGDASGVTTTTEAFRAAPAFLTASASLDRDSAAFAFDSTWTNGVSSTVGGHIDIAWTGDTAYIRLGFGVTGGIATVKNTAGATQATVTTSGYKNPFAGVVKIRCLGSGEHSVRLQIASGTITVAGLLIPSATPPTIIWQQEGPVPESSSTVNSLLTGSYQPACAAIATADFPTVVQVTAGTGWDGAAMTGADQLHPNDLGSKYYADRVISALRSITFRQGQNWVTKSAEPTYSTPAAAYTVTGAIAPAAATAVMATTANQIGITWARSNNDNGSTITSQLVQRSPAGAGTWTTAATLTPSATFAFRENTATGGYLFRRNDSGFAEMDKRTASTTYTALNTTATPVNSGDVLEVVMNGNTLIGKVNGQPSAPSQTPPTTATFTVCGSETAPAVVMISKSTAPSRRGRIYPNLSHEVAPKIGCALFRARTVTGNWMNVRQDRAAFRTAATGQLDVHPDPAQYLK
ncbi:hypothetical protein V3C33_14245 [Micrococcaceae bacterium Sec5.7]